MPSSQVKSDTIDRVVLRLLGIKPGTELDYEIYFNRIKDQLNAARGKRISGVFSPEEDQLLRAELKRVQKLKSSGKRFKVKEGRARVSSAPRPSRQPKTSKPTQKLLRSKGELVKAQSQKIARKEDTTVKKVNVKDVTPKNPIDALRGPLDSIFGILQSRFKFDQKQKEKKRKEEETEKRGKRESSLEGFKKGISEIVAATKKMLSPFEDIINRITRFIFYTLLGRAFTGFMDWMKDKGNQEKFNSFVEFLSKHWPALAGLYILFGTSLGKVVRGVVKLAARMVVALAMMIPKLFSFIRKNKKLSAVGFALGSYASGRVAEMLNSKEGPESASLAKPTDDLSAVKSDVERAKSAPTPKLNTFNLGGLVPKFAAGGINPFSGMDFSAGVPIKGAGKDDTLIAAKTGEAILTEKDQVDLSQRYVDKETGQPLNIPQYLSGRKPGQVPFSNLRFPTLGGGFFKGGTIPQFNKGGIVGGIQGIMSNIGNFFSGRSNQKPKEKKPNKPIKLQDFQLPEAQALLRTIRSAEHYKGTKNPYDVLFGGGTAPISQMTVKEVIDMYSTRKLPSRLGGTPVKYGSGSGAVGAYQFMPFTLEDLIRRGEVKPNQIMTPSLQDKLGWALARNRGVSISGLRQSGLSQGILDKIAPEWASLPHSGSGGKSFYGQPVKSIDFLRGTYNQAIPKKQTGGLLDFPPNIIPLKLNQSKLLDSKDKTNKKLGKVHFPKLSYGPQDNTRNKKLPELMFGMPTKSHETQVYFKGGLVKETTGVKNPHSAADRRIITINNKTVAVQPKEFVVTARATSAPGVLPALENLNRVFDSNSSAYLGKSSVRMPQITPPMSRATMPNIMELPPIMTSANGSLRPRASGLGGGSQVPSFSAVAPDNERDKNASIYGLVG